MDEDPAREEIFHPAGQEAYVFGAISLVEVFLSLFLNILTGYFSFLERRIGEKSWTDL